MTANTTQVQGSPAIVQGHGQFVDGTNVTMLFIKDSRGDLVDVLYYCATCAFSREDCAGALPWPAYAWPFGTTYCAECHVAVNHEPR